MTAELTETPPASPARKRRWGRILLFGGVPTVVLLLAFAPVLARPLVRGYAEDTLAERLGGRASIGELSLSWSGKVHLAELSVVEDSGAPIARVDRADAALDLLAALRGRYRFDLDLAGFEVVLRQRPDGTWNVQEWAGPPAAEEEGEEPEDGTPEPLDLQGAVNLSGGRVVVAALDGTSSIDALDVALDIRPPGEPSTWSASFDASRDGNPAGSLRSAGSLERTDAALDPRSLRANGKLEIASLPLALLEPFLGAGPAPIDLEGSLDVRLELAGDARGARFEGDIRASEVSLRRAAAEALAPLALEEPEIAVAFRGSLATEALDLDLESCELRSDLARGTVSGKLENLAALGASPQPSAVRVRDWKGELHYRPEKLDALLGTSLAASVPPGTEERVDLEAEATLEPPGTLSTWKATLATTQGGKPAGTFRTHGTLERRGEGFDARELAANGELVVETFPLALLEPFLATGAAPFEVRGELDATLGIRGDTQRSELEGSLGVRGFSLRRQTPGASLELVEPEVAIELAATLASERLDVELTRATLSSRIARGSLRGKLANARALLEPEPQGATVIEGFACELDYRPADVASLLGATLAEPQPGAEEHLALELDARVEPPGTASTFKAALRTTRDQQPAGAFRSEGKLERSGPGWDPKEIAFEAELGIDAFPLARAEPFLASAEAATRLGGEVFANFTVSGDAGRARIEGSLDLVELSFSRTAAGGPQRELAEPRVALTLAAEVETERLDVGIEACTFASSVASGSLAGRLENLAALTEESPEDAVRARDLRGELRYRPDRVDALLGTKLAAPAASPADPGAAPGEPVEERVTFELEAALEPAGKPSTWKTKLAATRGGREAGELRSEGRLERLSASFAPEELSGEASVFVDRFPLALLGPVLGAVVPEATGAPEVGGELEAKLVFSGDARRARLEGDLSARELRLRLPRAEGPPIELAEPELKASLAADVETERLDIALEKLALEAAFLRGSVQGRLQNLRSLSAAGADPKAQAHVQGARVEGLKGVFSYVPDRVAALCGPLLPVTLRGAEPESIAFLLSGELPSSEPAAMLGALSGKVELGLGGFETTGIVGTDGELTATLAQGEAQWTARADANGGKISSQGSTVLASLFDAEVGSKTTVSMKVEHLGANSRLAPLFAHIHPAFMAFEALDAAEVGGVVDCDFQLGYDGPLTGGAVASWAAFPKSLLQGKGTFAISGAKLSGAPLVQEMLELFGVDAGKDLTLKPLEFLVRDGRVSYAKDWTWTFARTQTSFAGSVGLDKTLALQWKVPVTDALVARYGFLESLRGETLMLPIEGTVTRPSLDMKGALKDLALKAAGRGILDGLGGGEGEEGQQGIGEILRERVGEEIGIGGAGADPAKLLADADKLWDAGQKVEAAALYSKLREEHKLSLVYTLNRDRIKERAKYKPQ